jgi:hypothetical protein
MKQETEICDVCKERVSNKKCELCEKDVCAGCSFVINLNIEFNRRTVYDNDSPVTTISACRYCNDLLGEADLEKTFQECELKKPILEILKKELVLLELGEHKTRAKPSTLGIPIAPRPIPPTPQRYYTPEYPLRRPRGLFKTKK